MAGGLWFAAASLSHDELLAGNFGLLVVFASACVFAGTNLGKRFLENEKND